MNEKHCDVCMFGEKNSDDISLDQIITITRCLEDIPLLFAAMQIVSDTLLN